VQQVGFDNPTTTPKTTKKPKYTNEQWNLPFGFSRPSPKDSFFEHRRTLNNPETKLPPHPAISSKATTSLP
jgi:hypothetical protein